MGIALASRYDIGNREDHGREKITGLKDFTDKEGKVCSTNLHVIF
jgi:hypothetical protein